MRSVNDKVKAFEVRKIQASIVDHALLVLRLAEVPHLWPDLKRMLAERLSKTRHG